MMKTKQGAVGGGRGEGAEQGLWEGLGELGGLGSLCHISGSTCHPHLTMLWGQGPLCPSRGGGTRMPTEGHGATGGQPQDLHQGRGEGVSS